MCCRLAASIMGTGPLSPGSVRVRYHQNPIYPTQPFPIPNLTLPYPQPYPGMGRDRVESRVGYYRAWVGH